jgi:RNA polymerase sigma-70 factor (sigma-E family)
MAAASGIVRVKGVGMVKGKAPAEEPSEEPSDDGFDRFMAERWPRVLRSAYLLTGDRHDAEDLAQAAFERACASWGKVRRAENPDAYLHRVLVNCHRGRYRKRRVPEYSVPAVPDGLRLVGDHADQQGERDVLMAALKELSPGQRAVIVLRFYEDLTEAQAAHVLRCSVGTVKSQTARALARLRRHGPIVELAPSTSAGAASKASMEREGAA